MIKIKYKGIKIKTDSIDEAVAILESLKDTQPPYPIYPLIDDDPGIWMAPNPDLDHWKVTCSIDAQDNSCLNTDDPGLC